MEKVLQKSQIFILSFKIRNLVRFIDLLIINLSNDCQILSYFFLSDEYFILAYPLSDIQYFVYQMMLFLYLISCPYFFI